MIMLSKYVWCTFEFEGFHEWKDAPDEVAYLKNKHRHIFKGRFAVEVFHNDRDIEFIILKNKCKEVIDRFLDKEHLGSCEMIAEVFLKQLSQIYKGRKLICEVSEDGENGAKIYWQEDENDSTA